MIDFEIAVLNVVRRMFPNLKVKGCLFHFGQSLFRYFVKIPGMKDLYLNNPQVQRWFKSVFLLALIPVEFVQMKFGLISAMADLPEDLKVKLQPFVQYVKKTYINSQYFTVEMWNHFATKFERTNNRVEADNGGMKKYCGAAEPDINKATRLLRQYETKSRIAYLNASKPNAFPYISRREDFERDTEFRLARKTYEKGKYTIEEYLEEIMDIFQFVPKKKYVEKVVDTSISDSTDNGGLSTIFSNAEGEDEFNMGGYLGI
jgi:hypothetical protein